MFTRRNVHARRGPWRRKNTRSIPNAQRAISDVRDSTDATKLYEGEHETDADGVVLYWIVTATPPELSTPWEKVLL